MHLRCLAPSLALLAAAPLSAQQRATPRFAVEGAALYATVNGGDFVGMQAGPGVDVQGRVAVSAFSLGAGFQRTSHDIRAVSEHVVLDGFFVEPRLGFAGRDHTMYLSGRVARLTQSVETTFEDRGRVELQSRGYTAGAGGGLEFALGDVARLNVSAVVSSISFDAFEVGGEELPDTEQRGWGLLLRAGLGVAFGSR